MKMTNTTPPVSRSRRSAVHTFPPRAHVLAPALLNWDIVCAVLHNANRLKMHILGGVASIKINASTLSANGKYYPNNSFLIFSVCVLCIISYKFSNYSTNLQWFYSDRGTGWITTVGSHPSLGQYVDVSRLAIEQTWRRWDEFYQNFILNFWNTMLFPSKPFSCFCLL